MNLISVIAFLWTLKLATFSDSHCVIELKCRECVPENMPLVTSHHAADGLVRVPAGGAVTLSCGAATFLAYPQRDALEVVCEGGRYRVQHDNALRHLLDLGCQEDMFEDVLHEVAGCGAPLQGRAYQVRAGGAGPPRHLATVCYDAERGLARAALVAPLADLPLPAHAHARSPLTILGNFNHMFDAKTRHEADALYSDDARLDRRLRELLKHERFAFAEQRLTSAKLLSERYFEEQEARASEFASNKVAAWGSVAHGNLRHVQRDVARLARARALLVAAGTRGELQLRAGPPLRLRARRFPVPRYVWTVAADVPRRRAVALVVLNDPFVAVSEIKEAVFCESACGRLQWLRDLRTHRNYETPVYGLTFCCTVKDFADAVPEFDRNIVDGITEFDILTD